MQLTRSADYAVRAMLEIAAQADSDESRARTHEIAERKEIPPALLAKLIPLLVRAGLLASQRGARGGLALARPASEISMLEIVEAIEGPIALNRCTTPRPSATKWPNAPFTQYGKKPKIIWWICSEPPRWRIC